MEHKELRQFSPTEFAEELEKKEDDWIRNNIRITRKGMDPGKYKKELIFTDCTAGFDHPTKAYWNHLELTHGITYAETEKKEEEINVPEVTAMEPMHRKLQSGKYLTTGKTPRVRKQSQQTAFQFIINGLPTETHRERVKTIFCNNMEDKRKPWSVQENNYEVNLILKAMEELLDDAADIEQIRQEGTEQQQKYRDYTKCSLHQEILARSERMNPLDNREIEVGTDCVNCLPLLSRCPCKKWDMRQVDTEQAILFAQACNFEPRDQTRQ